jgi:hypothetical protein
METEGKRVAFRYLLEEVLTRSSIKAEVVPNALSKAILAVLNPLHDSEDSPQAVQLAFND